MIASGKCPIEALIRLAEKAETEGDISQAINAWKSTLPYIYPRPKAVEFAPEDLIELRQNLAEARVQDQNASGNSSAYGERLARAIQKLSQAH